MVQLVEKGGEKDQWWSTQNLALISYLSTEHWHSQNGKQRMTAGRCLYPCNNDAYGDGRSPNIARVSTSIRLRLWMPSCPPECRVPWVPIFSRPQWGLVRQTPVNEALYICIPVVLSTCILLSLTPSDASQTWKRKKYVQHNVKSFFWLHMADGKHKLEKEYRSYVQKKFQTEHKRKPPPFRAAGPLEFVGDNLLGPIKTRWRVANMWLFWPTVIWNSSVQFPKVKYHWSILWLYFSKTGPFLMEFQTT